MKTPFYLVTSIFYLVFLTGCHKTNIPPDLPKLVSCKITVQQEGKPLTDASVFLVPQDSSKWNATGNTNKQGVAEMFTHGMYQGVVKGKYKVVLSKTESTNPPLVPTDQYQEKQKHFTLVEEVYGDTDKTPLEIDVARNTKEYSINAGKVIKKQLPDRESQK
jgi:hypothetical protein